MSRCAWASCKQPASERSGEWEFCSFHAEQDRAMQGGDEPEAEDAPRDLFPPEMDGHGTEARARKHYRDGENPCAPCLQAATRAAHDRTVRKMTTPTSTQPSLLERASGHHSAKVRRLGTRIEGLLSDLRTALKESEAEEETRRAIAEAEAKLKELKASLRKGSAAPTVLRPDSGSGVPLACRKGCGKVSNHGAGRAAHERSCTYSEPAEAVSA